MHIIVGRKERQEFLFWSGKGWTEDINKSKRYTSRGRAIAATHKLELYKEENVFREASWIQILEVDYLKRLLKIK